MKLVSLFSCGGIGDFGYYRAGFEPVIISDINNRRLSFARKLIPVNNVILGDIWDIKGEIIKTIKHSISTIDFAISLTPPCQGMSKNGAHALKKSIENGMREKEDQRNYLIIPSIEIIKETKPTLVLFENVPEVFSTYIIINQSIVSVAEYFKQSMKTLGYNGDILPVNTADYGIPQNRKRAFGVFSYKKLDLYTIFNNKMPVYTLRDAISSFPPLDARDLNSAQNTNFHPLHKVPVMRQELYDWVKNTAEGKSAFENNTCLICSFNNKRECLYCAECNGLLSKPAVLNNNKKRLIKGYGSTYRRQQWDNPANTVTTRSAFASSSYNLHPNQNRVLSIYECALLQGLNPQEVDWTEDITGKLYPDYFLRDIIGEAIPASFTEIFGKRILSALSN